MVATSTTPSAIRALALRNPRVREAASPPSMYLGPEEILLTLDVEFERDSTADEIVRAIARIGRAPADVGRPAIADPA